MSFSSAFRPQTTVKYQCRRKSRVYISLVSLSNKYQPNCSE